MSLFRGEVEAFSGCIGVISSVPLAVVCGLFFILRSALTKAMAAGLDLGNQTSLHRRIVVFALTEDA